MDTVKNQAKKPLRVPLPRGRFLFLGLGKAGQISAEAKNFPPLKALIEAGELEVLGEDHPDYQAVGPQGATNSRTKKLGASVGRR
jgi:hypothetical protein